MKSFVWVFLFVGICFSGFSQSQAFEGYIIYRYNYYSPEGEDITKEMLAENDSVQHYYINSENYISFGQNQNFQQLYNSKTNRYFFPREGNIMFLDASDSFGKKYSFEDLPEEKLIMGMNCKGVEVKNDEESTLYFYSEDIKVNPEPFKNHILGGFGPYLMETGGCLSLQIISKKRDFIMVMTAEFIQEIELPEDGFDIDALIQN